jgi:hypothetical protein
LKRGKQNGNQSKRRGKRQKDESWKNLDKKSQEETKS